MLIPDRTFGANQSSSLCQGGDASSCPTKSSSVSVLRGDVTVWGDGVRERKHFPSFSNLKSRPSLQQNPICPTGGARLCALHSLLRPFRMWQSQPHGRNLILWQNSHSESCSKAVDTPGLGLCPCRWRKMRKMSVWDPSRGQEGSQPQTETPHFLHYFFPFPATLTAVFWG